MQILAEPQDQPEQPEPLHPRDEFLRLIKPIYYHPETGKVYSQAFQNTTGTDRMSVNCERLSSVDDTLAENPGQGVAQLSTELCVSLHQTLDHTPDDDNHAHCDVVGEKPQRVRKALRDGAKLLAVPTLEDAAAS